MSEKKPAARREIKVAVAYPPHVTLLPPEVGQRKAANRARGRAIFVAIIAAGVAILAAVGANLVSFQRVLALDSARATTLSLTQQQGEYSEVRQASHRLQSSTSARIFATSTEISVKALLDGLGSKLSAGMLIRSYDFETATPLLGYGEPVSPLDPQRMAQFTIEVGANTIAEIDAWVRKAPDVAGVIGASVVSVEEDDGLYVASVSVFVSSDALLHRFDGFVPEGEAVEEEAEPAPSPTPTADPSQTPTPTDTPAPADGTTD
ncbi:fimbrial assembly protein [Salinibacterium sp. TMP30]|uniref:fimbrial assembly protein n=1 Tax=Salinibacterium sp. TMP30 TaxID=3138237 RepID=UPI003139A1B3